jgi:hypothetical protein
MVLENDPMEVEYEITRDDLFAFQWRAAFDSPRGRRIRRWSYLGWLLAVVLFAFVPAIGPHGITLSRVSVTFIVVAFAIGALLQWTLETRLMRFLIRRLLRDEKPERGQLGVHRLALDEEGVVERTAVNESRTTWAGVDRVEQDADYIFIYSSPAAAHVVPRRAFGDLQRAQAFHEFARARKAAAP